MKLPALGLLPDRVLHWHVFRQDAGLLLIGQLGPWHPGHFLGHVRRFFHLLKRNKTWDTSENSSS